MFLKAFLPVVWTTYAVAQNSTVQFDYLIAGAGTAGLLLATILSEDPNIKVLVLEAGGDSRTEANVTDPERRGECSCSN
jgi:choline dehydrogenase-like flavoprotein